MNLWVYSIIKNKKTKDTSILHKKAAILGRREHHQL